MGIEKKIYSPWAFKENEHEKGNMNMQIYKELKETHRVYRHDTKLDPTADINMDDYDVVIGRKAGYHHALYKVHKNTPNLSTIELALLCDSGNLCFGHTMEGDMIRVSED